MPIIEDWLIVFFLLFWFPEVVTVKKNPEVVKSIILL